MHVIYPIALFAMNLSVLKRSLRLGFVVQGLGLSEIRDVSRYISINIATLENLYILNDFAWLSRSFPLFIGIRNPTFRKISWSSVKNCANASRGLSVMSSLSNVFWEWYCKVQTNVVYFSQKLRQTAFNFYHFLTCRYWNKYATERQQNCPPLPSHL